MDVRMPDGTVISGVPDTATKEDVAARYSAYQASLQPAKEATALGEAAKSVEQMGSAYQTALGTLTSDPVAAVREGMARKEDLERKYGTTRGLNEAVAAYDTAGGGVSGALSATGETLSQVPQAVAGQAANLGAMYAGSKAGAMIGATAGTAIPVPIIGTIGGGALGGFAGAVLSQVVPFYQENLEAQLKAQEARGEKPDLNRASAAAVAVLQGSSEVAAKILTLGGALVSKIIGSKPAQQAEKALVEAAQKSLAAAAGRSLPGAVGMGSVRAIGSELPVEMAQNIMTRAQAGQSLTNEDALNDYKNTLFETVKVAGAIGSATGPLNRSAARSQMQEQGLTPAGTPINPELSPEEQAAREAEQQTVGHMRAQREEQEAAKAAQAPFIGQEKTETPEGQFGLNLEGGKRVAPSTTVQGTELPERKPGFDAYGRPKTTEEPAPAAAPLTGGEATPMTQALDTTQPVQQHRDELAALTQRLAETPDTRENKALRSQLNGRIGTLTRLIKTAEAVPVGTQGALPIVPAAEPTATEPAPVEPTPTPAPTTSALVRAAGIPASAPVAQQLKKLDLTQQADRTAAAEFIAQALANKNVKPETKAAIQAFYDQHIAQPIPDTQGGLDLGEPQPLVQVPPTVATPAAPVAPPVAPTTPTAAVTPDTAPPLIDTSVWNALGIGPTAKIRKNVDVNGKDITDPTDGAFVRQALEAYRDASKSARIKANIDKYLARFPVPAATITPPPPPPPQTPVEKRVASGQIEDWAKKAFSYNNIGTIMYADNNFALVYRQSKTGFDYEVLLKNRSRTISVNTALAIMPPSVAAGITEAHALIEARENAALAKTPDGPFTNAASNVVASASVDPRYVQYITALMQKLGMGNINLFLFQDKDLVGNKDLYNLHGPYSVIVKDPNQPDSKTSAGWTHPYGPAQDALVINIADLPSSLEDTLETLSHELGHGIEFSAFVNAPQATQDAIIDEYRQWRFRANNMTVEQLINSLRNRVGASLFLAKLSPTVLQAPIGSTTLDLNYWLGFPEWFADNVSRWASTDAKAIGVVEKFFQDVAKQLRALVAAVTGMQFAPNSAVADFLNKMGPSSPVAWQGSIAQPRVQPKTTTASEATDLTDAAEIDALDIAPSIEEVGESTIGRISQSINTPPGQILPSTWNNINQAPSQAQRTAMTQFAAVQAQGDVSWADWFRQKTVDVFAPVATKLGALFDQGVRNSFGDVNPVQFIRQAFDHARVALDVFKQGGLRMNKDGFWESYQLKDANGKEMSAQQVVKDIAALAKKNNEAYNVTKGKVATVLEGMRLSDLRKENATLETLAQGHEANGDFDLADKTREKKFLLHMRFAEIDTLEQVFQASPELQEIQRIMNASRESVVDAMVTSGRISAERGDFWKAVTNYVPFDRVNNVYEDLSLTQRPTRKGIASLGELPKLRGSLKRPVANTVDNYMNTMAWMVDQSMRNSAAVRVLNLMATPGVNMANKLPSMSQATNTHMVVPKLYENGEPVYFELHSLYDFAAFVQAPEITSGALKLLGASSRLLRTTVTATPMFAIKQVIDDAQRVMFYSGVKNPTAALATVFKHFPSAWFGAWIGKQSGLEKKLVSLGIIGDYDFNPTNPIETLEYQTGAEKRGFVRALINKLEQVTKASDMAARMAVYERTLKETGDPAVAQVRARELINFNRRGSSKAMNVLAHTVPFFNAYAQGLDLMYRGVTGKDASSGLNKRAARNFFISRMVIMTGMGFLYAAAMSDDDQYEDLTDEVRDRNWILPKSINEGLGVNFPIKISVPSELGFIFKSIPERIVSYMKAASKGEDQGVGHAVTSTLSDALKTYGTVPIPPVLKSAMENTANYSFFTHRELVPKVMQERPAYLQYTSNTSELGKAIGKTADVSPIKVDNWIRGTFGLMGASGLLVTDAMMNPARPDRSLAQIPFMSIALVNPAGSRVKDEFYEFRQKITEAVAAKNMLEKENPVKYYEFVQKNYHLLAAAPYVNQKLKMLSELRATKEMFTNMPAASMTSAEKRKNIDEINRIEKIMLSDMRTMRSAIQKTGPK